MGFSIARQKGSHVIMKRGDKGCVVPFHKEIRVGTLAGLLRQGCVDPEDFIKEYNG